jgi:hypothetical protein
VSRKAPKVLTFPEECARALKSSEDILDRLYKRLAAEMRKVGFAIHPKWQQHELIREDGATRYITHSIGDKLQQCEERSFIWADFTLKHAAPGRVVCEVRLQLERYADNDTSARDTIPRVLVRRHQELDWPDTSLAVWMFAIGISPQIDQLVEQFRDEMLDTISP